MEDNENICIRMVDPMRSKTEGECLDCCMTCKVRCDKVCLLVKHFETCPEMVSKQKQAFKEIFRPKKQ